MDEIMTRNFFFEINLHKVSQMDYILGGEKKNQNQQQTIWTIKKL